MNITRSRNVFTYLNKQQSKSISRKCKYKTRQHTHTCGARGKSCRQYTVFISLNNLDIDFQEVQKTGFLPLFKKVQVGKVGHVFWELGARCRVYSIKESLSESPTLLSRSQRHFTRCVLHITHSKLFSFDLQEKTPFTFIYLAVL